KLVLLETIERRHVGVVVRLLENAVKIADRLMVVQDQAKTNRIHGRYYRQNAKGFRLWILDFRPHFLTWPKNDAKPKSQCLKSLAERPQMLGCGFGRVGIDEAARAPFEAGHLR